MNESKNKNGNSLFCENCGIRLQIKDIENNPIADEFAFCQYCGTKFEIKNIFVQDNIHSEEKYEDKRINNKEQEIRKTYKYPIERVYYDPDFPKLFKQNLVIIISRLIYDIIGDVERHLKQKIKKSKLKSEVLKNLEDFILPITEKKIQRIYLENLYKKLRTEEFNTYHAKFQEKIKKDPFYKSDVEVYLKWIISHIFIIIKEKWNSNNLSHFYEVIRDELKKFIIYKKKKEEKIRDMIKLAHDLGLEKTGVPKKCLSKEYFNNKTKLLWKCGQCGYEFYNFMNEEDYKKSETIYDGIYTKSTFPIKKYFILDKEKTKSLIDKLRLELSMTNKSISDYIHTRIGDIIYQSKSIPEDSFNLLQQLANEVNIKLKVRGVKEIKKYSILDMQELARVVGIEKTGIEGECLSKNYINMKTELKWRCGACRYVFSKNPDKVKIRKEWCPRCSNNPHFLHKQITIEDMHELAYDVGMEKTGVSGRCLSNKYINSSTELEWYCGKCENKFFMTPNDIKSKRSWCPRCAGKEQTIEDMRILAYEVGLEKTKVPGFCLSDEYKGATSKLRWKCGACKHEFTMTPNKVKSRRSWCSKCAHKVTPTIKGLRKLAYEVGLEKTGAPGEFLSNIYKGSDKLHNWRCGKCKKIFKKRIYKVKKRRSWCPHCSKGYYEKVFRCYMERIFSYLYKKQIKFLETPLIQIVLNIEGREGLARYDPNKINFDITRMHLDGFNLELLVGFERQGRQHYIRVPEWQKKEEDHERQLEIDQFKIEFCEKQYILLIVLGYEMRNGEWKKIELEEMQEKIIRQIEEKTGKKLPPIPKFDHRKFFVEDYEDEIQYRKKLGDREGFNYLTDFQRRILLEFSKGSYFALDLLKLNYLDDIKSLEWMIRDLYKKRYLKRIIAYNPSTLSNNKRQYKYSLTKLGRELLELSLS